MFLFKLELLLTKIFRRFNTMFILCAVAERQQKIKKRIKSFEDIKTILYLFKK